MTRLERMRDRMAAKQSVIIDVLTAAGKDLDFSRPEVLQALGRKTTKGAFRQMQRLNRDLEALGRKVMRAELERIKGEIA
jgi:hypothetical protein